MLYNIKHCEYLFICFGVYAVRKSLISKIVPTVVNTVVNYDTISRRPYFKAAEIACDSKNGNAVTLNEDKLNNKSLSSLEYCQNDSFETPLITNRYGVTKCDPTPLRLKRYCVDDEDKGVDEMDTPPYCIDD